MQNIESMLTLHPNLSEQYQHIVGWYQHNLWHQLTMSSLKYVSILSATLQLMAKDTNCFFSVQQGDFAHWQEIKLSLTCKICHLHGIFLRLKWSSIQIWSCHMHHHLPWTFIGEQSLSESTASVVCGVMHWIVWSDFTHVECQDVTT